MDYCLVEMRLQLLNKYLKTLEDFQSVSLNEFLDKFDNQLIVERLLYLILDISSGINRHILLTDYQGFPETNELCFLELGKNGIISSDLASNLADWIKIRDILEYQHENLDLKVVYACISRALEEYPLYMRQVNNYLNSLEVNNG
ncbi:DUF86 domain-containing protein [Oscillatoria sp. HE19RPO]|uniref:type VII toxin-antitoxin system HepT family RNase toxin n=1 Tax=Oscillatoria sp. HE19RPO TaxID=2954806 RepID=UPI0020C4EDEA|nr:HepT-like ribonuclease domain-containing protein [Oscillatoria sp. HE19RPO]